MMRQYELVERVLAYDPSANEALLNRAYVYAMKAHGNQKRASGDPYFSHPLEVAAILTDLNERGVQRLLVEGGGHIHTMFLTSGLVDELRLAVAPFFIGDTSAPRFLMSGDYPFTPKTPMRLVETRKLGDVAVLRYCMRTPA